MKALSLWQPWASLVAVGAKTVETRSWSTDYRGPLAIHSTQNWSREHRELANTGALRDSLVAAGLDPGDLPLGRIVATCFLSMVYPSEPGERPEIPALEYTFGDFSPGRYAWFLAEIRTFIRPVRATGAQRLWTWDPPSETRTRTRPAFWTSVQRQ